MPRAKPNPPLAIFANPRAPVISRDVKAIVYCHAETGELLVHGFGPDGERIGLETRGNRVTITHLPDAATGDHLLANADGSVTIKNGAGKRLWQEFP